jgi:hypothetical protein
VVPVRTTDYEAAGLLGGVDGGRLFVRVFDGVANVRKDIAGDVLASGTTMQWNTAAKVRNAGAVMADASLNRRQTIRVGAGVAFAQVGIVGFDGQIELEALRLFGLPDAAPAVLYACPSVPVGTREFQAEVSWDLPSLASGATELTDVTVSTGSACVSSVARHCRLCFSFFQAPSRAPMLASIAALKVRSLLAASVAARMSRWRSRIGSRPALVDRRAASAPSLASFSDTSG